MTIIINPVPLPPFGGQTYNQITPFTYRDGLTYIEVLESFRAYIRDTLVPFVDEGFDNTEGYVNSAVAELSQFVNDTVQLIVDDSIQVQDPVLAGILADIDSESRTYVETIFANKATQNTVETGRLSPAQLNNAFANKTTQETVETGRLSTAQLNNTIDAQITDADIPGQASAVAAPVAQSSARHVTSGRIYNPLKLARWMTALSGAETAPAVVTVLGDSKTHGIGSDNLNGGTDDTTGLYRQNAWPVILRKLFARAYDLPVATNYVGLYPAYQHAAPSGVSRSDTLGPYSSYTSGGFAYGGYALRTAGSNGTLTIPASKAGRFTHLDLFYWGSDSGVVTPGRPTINVDGNTEHGGAVGPFTGGHLMQSVSGLTDTTHEIVIGNGTSPNNAYTHGLVTHFGRGVVVNRIGAPGARANHITSAAAGQARNRTLEASVLAGYTDLLILEISTNDVSNQTALATWKAQVQEVIDVAEGAGACVMLVAPSPLNNGESFAIPESAYREVMAELSDENSHTAYLDVSGVFGDRASAVADGLYPPGHPTTVHPGPDGHRRYAQAIFDALPLANL